MSSSTLSRERAKTMTEMFRFSSSSARVFPFWR